jgi:hypothetical protein
VEDVGPALGVEAGVEDGFEHCCGVPLLRVSITSCSWYDGETV